MMSYTHSITETMISYGSRVHKTTKTALYFHLRVFVWYANLLLNYNLYKIRKYQSTSIVLHLTVSSKIACFLNKITNTVRPT